jgi:predicted metal-binding protein
VIISVCSSCSLGAGGFATPLAAALADAGIAAQVVDIACMSGCARPSAIAFRAPDKTAYLFGDLTAADLPDLITFARLYADSADGDFADARPLGALRGKALARIPGVLSQTDASRRKTP